jgi:hypothetical protein
VRGFGLVDWKSVIGYPFTHMLIAFCRALGSSDQTNSQ